MTIKEKQEICVKALTKWFVQEQENYDFKNHDEEIANLFTSKILLKKLLKYDIILNFNIQEKTNINLYRCITSKKENLKKIYNMLYNNISKENSLFLKRKKEKFEGLL